MPACQRKRKQTLRKTGRSLLWTLDHFCRYRKDLWPSTIAVSEFLIRAHPLKRCVWAWPWPWEPGCVGCHHEGGCGVTWRRASGRLGGRQCVGVTEGGGRQERGRHWRKAAPQGARSQHPVWDQVLSRLCFCMGMSLAQLGHSEGLQKDVVLRITDRNDSEIPLWGSCLWWAPWRLRGKLKEFCSWLKVQPDFEISAEASGLWFAGRPMDEQRWNIKEHRSLCPSVQCLKCDWRSDSAGRSGVQWGRFHFGGWKGLLLLRFSVPRCPRDPCTPPACQGPCLLCGLRAHQAAQCWSRVRWLGHSSPAAQAWLVLGGGWPWTGPPLPELECSLVLFFKWDRVDLK